MNFLIIDTASQMLQIGLLLIDKQNNEKLYQTTKELAWKHGEQVQVEIDELVKAAGLQPSDLGAVIASQGPGSFTGLRTGLACAKGICAALELELLGITSLDAIAWPYHEQEGLVISCLDAKKSRFYSAIYYKGRAVSEALDLSLEQIAELAESIRQVYSVTSPSLLICPDEEALKLAFNALPSHLQSALSICVESTKPWIAAMGQLGKGKYLKKDFLKKDDGALYVRNSEHDLGIHRKQAISKAD